MDTTHTAHKSLGERAELNDEKAANRPPVTVLSGFLGAGKITVLSHIVNDRACRQVVIIVNDMSELNIDASTVHDPVCLDLYNDMLASCSLTIAAW